MESALHRPVLILNKHQVAIDTTTCQEALSDVFGRKAKILHSRDFTLHDIEDWMKQEISDGDRFVRASSRNILVPELIVSRYDRIPKRSVVFSRRNLWKRDRLRCQYCGQIPPQEDITIDHVVPKSIWYRQKHSGSVTCFENCVLACLSCNKKKDARTPEQANMKLRRMEKCEGGLRPVYYDRPKTPHWSPIYSMRRIVDFPKSWSYFLQNKNDDLYWDVELKD